MTLTAVLVSKTGANGANGQQIRLGAGDPPNSGLNGIAGDTFFDSTNYRLYAPFVSQFSNYRSVQGQTGPAGALTVATPPQVPNIALSFGSLAGFAVPTSVTTTPVALPYAGSTVASPVFSPTVTTSLAGALVVNKTAGSNTSVLASLWDLTTNSQIYVASAVAPGNVTNFGNFGINTYAMVAGHDYQWRIAGSAAGTTTCCVFPRYWALGGGGGLSYVWYPAGHYGDNTSAQTMSSSAQPLVVAPGSAFAHNVQFPSQASIYNVVVASTFSTASIKLNGLSITASAGVSAYGPFTPIQYPLAGNTAYNWTVSGNAGEYGTVSVALQVLT